MSTYDIFKTELNNLFDAIQSMDGKLGFGEVTKRLYLDSGRMAHLDYHVSESVNTLAVTLNGVQMTTKWTLVGRDLSDLESKTKKFFDQSIMVDIFHMLDNSYEDNPYRKPGVTC